MLMGRGFACPDWRFSNGSPPTDTTPGDSVTAGASNVKGSWATIATAAEVAQDVRWMHIDATGFNTTAETHPGLMDIGVDLAGGTSFTTIFANLQVGGSGSLIQAGQCSWTFPYFIPAGASIGARAQDGHATPKTFTVGLTLYGMFDRPEWLPCGAVAETLGADTTTSKGTAVTPGNASWGTWTSLGSTTLPLWWWQMGVHIDNAAATAREYAVQLGVGDGTTLHLIQEQFITWGTAERGGNADTTAASFLNAYRQCAGGSTLYARAYCDAAPDSGFSVMAVGVGG